MNINDSSIKKALAEKEKLCGLKGCGSIKLLEDEWAKFKYLILGKNPNGYKAIRNLLKDKSAFPAEEFYSIVDASLSMPENTGFEINAAQHVAGYFKNLASVNEKNGVNGLIRRYKNDAAGLSELKSALYLLAVKYKVKYLTESYYFADV